MAWVPHPGLTVTDAEGFWQIEGLVVGAPYVPHVMLPGSRFYPVLPGFTAGELPLDLGPLEARG